MSNNMDDLFANVKKMADSGNIPDDIKDDWKDAIKEFLDFIMTSEENEVIIYRNKYINELSEVQYKIL